MARTIQRLLVPITLMVVVLAAATALGDVKITMTSESMTPHGKQEKTVVQYYTPTKMRSEYGESNVMIIDLDEGWMVTLIASSKMYIRQTFEALREQAAAVRMAAPEVKIEETDDEETISDYECRKVIVRVVDGENVIVTDYWVAKDVKGIEDAHAFSKAMFEKVKDIATRRASQEVGLYFATNGLFPIRTVIHLPAQAGGLSETMTVTTIEEGDVDEELFEVPDDYQELSVGGTR